MRHLLAATALLALAACGTERSESPLGIAADIVVDRIAGARGAEPAAPAAAPAPLPPGSIVVQVPTRQAVAPMAPVGTNGDKVTFLSDQAIGLTTQNGQIIATRGFGPDLMSATGGGLAAALSGSTDSFTRTVERLTGGDQVEARSYDCAVTGRAPDSVTTNSVTYATTRVDVTCQAADGGGFVEQWWMDAGGLPRRSTQWVTTQLGHIVVDLL
ncbi:MAG: YjbF family lipoprotein [Paracoccaceae bacterium]